MWTTGPWAVYQYSHKTEPVYDSSTCMRGRGYLNPVGPTITLPPMHLHLPAASCRAASHEAKTRSMSLAVMNARSKSTSSYVPGRASERPNPGEKIQSMGLTAANSRRSSFQEPQGDFEKIRKEEISWSTGIHTAWGSLPMEVLSGSTCKLYLLYGGIFNSLSFNFLGFPHLLANE